MLGRRAFQVAALLAVFAAPPPAAAQGASQLTERGCAIVADMTLVARSLAVEKVERDLAARIMTQVYGAYGAGVEMSALRDKVVVLAYGRTEQPMELARLVGTACLRSGGDQGAMFGTRIRWRPVGPWT